MPFAPGWRACAGVGGPTLARLHASRRHRDCSRPSHASVCSRVPGSSKAPPASPRAPAHRRWSARLAQTSRGQRRRECRADAQNEPRYAPKPRRVKIAATRKGSGTRPSCARPRASRRSYRGPPRRARASPPTPHTPYARRAKRRAKRRAECARKSSACASSSSGSGRWPWRSPRSWRTSPWAERRFSFRVPGRALRAPLGGGLLPCP